MKEHCDKTEPCADDTYCGCICDLCLQTDCFRPGCDCKKSHLAREIYILEIEKYSCEETIREFTKNDGRMDIKRMETIVYPLEDRITEINRNLYKFNNK